MAKKKTAALSAELLDQLLDGQDPETVLRADGRYVKLLNEFARTQLRVLDDWGIAPVGDDARRDLLEILDGRHPPSATCD